jgi:3',5'-cyclic AMP phosphodiesterase CpdA
LGRSRLSHHWRPQFALPENGPAGLEETCYTLTYQNLLIVGLNSNRDVELQTPWLDKVLEENKLPWVVCTFHHPIFSTGNNRDNPSLRAAWKPIFDKHRVDFVLQGHDHTYGRTGLEVPDTVGNVATGVNKVDAQTGTVYRLSRKPFMVRAAEDTQLYQIIHIDGERLRYEARTAIGQVYDAFVLEKQPGQINKLTEIPVALPERVRAGEAATLPR